MSELFGNTATPKWLDPTERSIMNQEEGRKLGESFSHSFDSSFAASSERAYKEQRENQIQTELTPLANALKGVNSYEDVMGVVSKNPEWLMNPRTAPLVENTVNTFANAEKIKLSAANSRVYADTQKRLSTWNDAKGDLTGEDGELAMSRINAMPNQGMILDSMGRPIDYTAEAKSEINSFRKQNKLLPVGVTARQYDPSVLQQQKDDAKMKQIEARGQMGRGSAAIAEANQLDDWTKKAAELKAAGDTAGAASYEKRANDLRSLKKIVDQDAEPKFTDDPSTGERFIKWPGYAPVKLKDRGQEFEAKALLHDYYKASDNYYAAKKAGEPAEVVGAALSDVVSKRKALQKFHGPPAQSTAPAPAPTAAPQATNAPAAPATGDSLWQKYQQSLSR